MNLSFKEWIITEAKKKQLLVHQDMKQWVKSVESLEKELETLKSIFKAKKLDTKKDDKSKDVTKKINVIDKKLDATKDKKPGDKKPEEKPEKKHELPSGEKQVPKPAPFLRKGKENVKEPTKVDKDQTKGKKVNGNDRPS
jgi:hypothetical protein